MATLEFLGPPKLPRIPKFLGTTELSGIPECQGTLRGGVRRRRWGGAARGEGGIAEVRIGGWGFGPRVYGVGLMVYDVGLWLGVGVDGLGFWDQGWPSLHGWLVLPD